MLDFTIHLEDGTSLGLYHLRGMQRVQQVRAKINRDADLRAAFPFIEVVRNDPVTDMRRFEGISLAQFIDDRRPWDPAGVDALMRALGPHQRDLRIVVRQLAGQSTDGTLIQWPRPPFISSLACEIARHGPSQARAGHWQAFVSGLATAGVRADEIRWSGLSDRLDVLSADAVLPRERIMDLLDLTHVTPRVVNQAVVGFCSTAGWRSCHEPLTPREIRRAGLSDVPPAPLHTTWFRHRALGWRAVHVEHRDLFVDSHAPWIVLDHRGRRALGLNVAFESSADACAWAERMMAQEFASWPIRRQVHRWARYAVSGGGAYEESLFQLDDFVDDFWTDHFFPVRNVLLHVRWSLHVSVEGRRLLFLDEVQSDWHKCLAMRRTDSPNGTIPMAPFHKEWPLLALKMMLWRAQELGCEGIALSTGEMQLKRWAEYGPPTSLYDQTLVHEARNLARVLGTEVGRTSIAIALADTSESTDPDAAAATGSPPTRTYTVPVIWLGAVPQVRAIPLFGLGRRDDWFQPPAAASIGRPLPIPSHSPIARIRAA